MSKSSIDSSFGSSKLIIDSSSDEFLGIEKLDSKAKETNTIASVHVVFSKVRSFLAPII